MSTLASPSVTQAPAWAKALRRGSEVLLYDFGGGPRPLKFSWIINAQKGGSFAFYAALMLWYSSHGVAAATGTAAWIYLALHGTYGLCWLLKDLCFPDPNWQRRITLPSSVVGAFGLGLYWSFGWLLISGTSTPHYPLPESAWLCFCVSLGMLGGVIMIAADAQKFYTLRVKRGLIIDGVFRYVRHPNYLGEMMVYASFALVVWHWLPVAILALFWLGLFAPNMALKEASMARYPQWAAYKKTSWWLFPGLL